MRKTDGGMKGRPFRFPWRQDPLARGTQFRIWTLNVLGDHVLMGYESTSGACSMKPIVNISGA